jgi:transketolase
MTDLEIRSMALRMRRHILDVSHTCNLSTHLGGALSMVEIMAVLYGRVLSYERLNPRWPGRDRFILSKGHGVLGYFSALLAAGLITEEKYKTFQTNESDLIAHPVMNLDLGIESSNGSLGQGLSMGVGIALSAKKRNETFKVYVFMGDGECNEGSVWEAAMLAAQLKLDNLIAVVDYNKLQSDGDSRTIIDLADLSRKFNAFGWDAYDIDGHDINKVTEAFRAQSDCGKPKVLVAHTIKGKGISFMENNNEWHHNRLTKKHYDLALAEVGSPENMVAQ